MSLQDAGRTAYDLQMVDDNRAENVAALFIEDALRVHGYALNDRNFAGAEKEADHLWHQGKRT